jgi:hypothetical protein
MQHHVADADCLPGLEHHVTRLPVAFVEQAERRHTLRHRCRAETGINAASHVHRHDIL